MAVPMSRTRRRASRPGSWVTVICLLVITLNLAARCPGRLPNSAGDISLKQSATGGDTQEAQPRILGADCAGRPQAACRSHESWYH